MNKEVESLLIEKQIPEGFIKVTDQPVQTLTSQQKVILNRKGNVLFNEGNIEGARRIFITTGYSDGLTRVADKYSEKKQYLKALRIMTEKQNLFMIKLQKLYLYLLKVIKNT